MALGSTGALSLGGDVTGQSINLELGQAAITMVSLNDSNVRALAGVSSGQISLPGDFWGKSSIAYWFGSTTVSGASSTANQRSFVDSSGNIYVVGQWQAQYSYALKINSSFTSILASKLLGSTTTSNIVNSMVTDGSSIFTIGSRRWNSTTPTRSGASIVKYDLNFNYISDKFLYELTTSNYSALSSTYSNGSIYAAYFSGNKIIKVDASTLNVTACDAFSSFNQTYVITSDPSNNIYFNALTGFTEAIGKYNSSFSLQYCFSHNSSGSNSNILYYSNGYLYTGEKEGRGSASLHKIDASNLSIVNTNALTGQTWYIVGAIADASGNIYVAWWYVADRFTLVKYNSSLTIQWQRDFVTNSALTGSGINLNYNPDGSLLLIYGGAPTAAPPTQRLVYIKYPLSGSITGSYTVDGNTITISASSYSSIAQSVSAYTVARTRASATATSQTPPTNQDSSAPATTLSKTSS
jgi:hypothetical protein